MQRFSGTTLFAVLALIATTAQAGHPADSGAAPTFSDAVKGYAWASSSHAPLNTAYSPGANYSYHATGGAIQIMRSDEGQYYVQFNGLGHFAIGGHAQVSAYDASASCDPSSWNNVSGNLRVYVRCRDSGGDLVNSQFNVVFVSSQGAAVPAMAYAWADQPAAADYVPNTLYSWNGAGGTINVQRFGTGNYVVTYNGMGAVSGGHAQVSAYGSGDARCRINTVESGGFNTKNVYVRCHRADGTLVDSAYTVLFLGSADRHTGYALANNSGAASYTPPAATSANQNGAILAIRSGAGVYGMTLHGLGGLSSGGMVLVSSYGSTFARHCTVGGWGSSGADFHAVTRCYEPEGVLSDSPYSILVTWPNRVSPRVFADGFEGG